MTNEELLTHLDRRFAAIDKRFMAIDKRFEQLEEDVHQTRVVSEATHSDMKLLAETVMHVNGRVNEAREQPLEQIRDMNTLHELRTKLVEKDVKDQFRQIARLAKRVSTLERRSSPKKAKR